MRVVQAPLHSTESLPRWTTVARQVQPCAHAWCRRHGQNGGAIFDYGFVISQGTVSGKKESPSRHAGEFGIQKAMQEKADCSLVAGRQKR